MKKSIPSNAVSYVTDLTTDDVNKRSYLDFSVFWITVAPKWELKHAQYACAYFPERHSGLFVVDRIFEMVLRSLRISYIHYMHPSIHTAIDIDVFIHSSDTYIHTHSCEYI